LLIAQSFISSQFNLASMSIKSTLISLSSVLILSINCMAQNNWETMLIQYRDSIDAEFSDPERSILPQSELEKFAGIDYFNPDESWNIEVKIKKIKKPEMFSMATSTDRAPEYKAFAKIFFKRDGKKHVLTLYQSIDLMKREEYKDYLFLPFTDLTSGEEAYGGGRYLELSISDLEDNRIDFNYAFNPYCAYNHKYSCPIPPLENHLEIKVNAGAKAYTEN